MAGTLFVVATPIGNLEDLTFRALRVLREVDLIAAEDTRHTAKLLTHYEVRRPVISVREHNESRAAADLVRRMQAGQSIALVTDAGTPGISDPGARVVAAARAAGLAVIPIPGPSALTAALSVTGIDASQFLFLGFPPPSGARRTKWLDRLANEPAVCCFFEAPHRLLVTLADVRIRSGVRPIYIHREISKVFESLVEWDNSGHRPHVPARGEFCVVVGAQQDAEGSSGKGADSEHIYQAFRSMTSEIASSRQDAEFLLAKVTGRTDGDIRSLVRKSLNSVVRQKS